MEMFSSAKGKAAYMMVLILVVYMFDYADRMIVSSLLPFIKEDWHVSDTQLGMLTSIVSLFIAICVLPVSILVDRWSRKKMISIMVFIWSLATLMCSFANNYTQLLILRALTGIGEAAYCPAAVALIVKVFPKEYRTRYLGINDAAAPIGAGIGLAVGGYIGMMLGWRHAFGLVAIPGLILSVLFLFVNDYKTLPLTNSKKGNSATKDLLLSIKKLFYVKTLWNFSFAYACCIAVNTSVMVWCPSFLNRFHHLEKNTAGTVCGLVAVLVLIGAPLGGYISDVWEHSLPKAKVYVAFFSILACGLSLAGALWINNTSICIMLLIIFGITNSSFLAPVTSIIQEVVHPGLRAVAFGINVLIINLIGAFTAPIIVGWISDYTGLRTGMSILPFFAGIAAIIVYFSSKRYFLDKANVSVLLK